MTNKLIALNKKDIDNVSGGLLAAVAMAALDTGVALASIEFIKGAGNYFCAGNNSTACGAINATVTIVSFSQFGIIPILDAALTTTVATVAATAVLTGTPPKPKDE